MENILKELQKEINEAAHEYLYCGKNPLVLVRVHMLIIAHDMLSEGVM